jgi:tetratricopeptide (TPR) repeat protein
VSPAFKEVLVRRSVFAFLAPAFVLVLAGIAVPAAAQIPDTFENLQILPKDISRQDLMNVMREFTGALGVRCNACHVPGPDPGSLQGFDFASDEPKNKDVARGMLKMTHEINHTLLPAAGKKDALQVRCVTCHRGVPEPEPLADLLLEEAQEKGVPAASAKYRELREMFYGSAAYDFRPATLDKVAETLAQERKDVDGAIAMARLGLEYDPESVRTLVTLGQLLAGKGEKKEALVHLEKAVALEPDDDWAKRALEQVKGAP